MPKVSVVGSMYGCRCDKPNASVPHLSILVRRHAFLQREQVLCRNSLGFVENLPPTISAGGFHRQHPQPLVGKVRVAIRLGIGKEKVRQLARLGHRLIGEVLAVLESFLFQYGLDVQLQGPAGTGLPPLQDGVGALDEARQILESAPDNRQLHGFFQALEDLELAPPPFNQPFVNGRIGRSPHLHGLAHDLFAGRVVPQPSLRNVLRLQPAGRA